MCVSAILVCIKHARMSLETFFLCFRVCTCVCTRKNDPRAIVCMFERVCVFVCKQEWPWGHSLHAQKYEIFLCLRDRVCVCLSLLHAQKHARMALGPFF